MRSVKPGGYLWWYVDALSDDGRSGLTLIAFIGSVFSPYYAWAGRKDPHDHVAINVALYGAPQGWTMTERGRRALARDTTRLTIGPSALSWTEDGLSVTLDERMAPVPKPLRGRLTVRPVLQNNRTFFLDAEGRHRWRPVWPRARIEVDLDAPAARWSGSAYFDTNDGDEPMQDAFQRWDWSRGDLADGGCALLYDLTPRPHRGPARLLSLRLTPEGQWEEVAPPPPAALPAGPSWGVARGIRSTGPARVVETLEDTPFYTRSLVESVFHGETVRSVHESLDLDRLTSRWVPWLLPFRMPRRP
ncbi:carotenoid 1,2-hydratase [Pararhodospirillum photometricum]|nr:carotenoid 1,2-hydratase [Pararhodospirillum photometricum]